MRKNTTWNNNFLNGSAGHHCWFVVCETGWAHISLYVAVRTNLMLFYSNLCSAKSPSSTAQWKYFFSFLVFNALSECSTYNKPVKIFVAGRRVLQMSAIWLYIFRGRIAWSYAKTVATINHLVAQEKCTECWLGQLFYFMWRGSSTSTERGNCEKKENLCSIYSELK